MSTVDYIYGERAVESNLNRVIRWTKEGSVTLSACRGDKTDRENLENTKKLIEDLKEYGYGYIPLFGQYIEQGGRQVTEYSFLVPYTNKSWDSFDDMVSSLQILANNYNQESVLVVKDGRGTLLYKNGLEQDVGEFTYPTSQTQYTSALARGNHRGRKWAMEGVVGFPVTFNGRMGASKLGELE